MAWLDKTGALYIITKIRSLLDLKVDKVNGKGLSTNDYTTDEKNKLSGIASGANKYTHPAYTAKASGLYKVTVDASGHVSATAAVTKADITGLGIPGQDTNTTYSAMKGATSSAAGTAGLVPAPAAGNETKYLKGDGTWGTPANTTYGAVTQSANGLMSAADKKKLDGFGAASTYALKSDITNMYRYKGSVDTEAKLPTTGQKTGDVYNIVAISQYGPAGVNVAWNGTTWDNLGGIFQIDAITQSELDAMFSYDASTKTVSMNTSSN